MTSATTTIPFSSVKFIEHMPRVSDVEIRLKKFLKALRHVEEDVGASDDEGPAKMEAQLFSRSSDLLTSENCDRIRRRAMRYVECVIGSTGMLHLREEQRAELTTLRGDLPIPRIMTEHEADEIAAALHAEAPWMSAATEEVWQRHPKKGNSSKLTCAMAESNVARFQLFRPNIP